MASKSTAPGMEAGTRGAASTGLGVRAGGWLLVAAATFVGVFVLPYRFPLSEPVLSDTYIAGANNQVAAIAVACISLGVMLVCWWRGRGEAGISKPEALSHFYLAGGVVAVMLWTAALGSAVARSHVYWRDGGYFLHQLRSGLLMHQQIYRGFEFAYGPALYWWPTLFIRAAALLGASTEGAMYGGYLLSLAVMQAMGLGIVFYTVQALPMGRTLKAAGFLLMTCGALNSLLGLNYTSFRFALPFAAIVLVSRQRRVALAAGLVFAGELLQMTVSPELGLAFAGAAGALALYRVRQEGWAWLWVGVAALPGAALFLKLAGPDFLSTLALIRKGGYNELLTPQAYVLALLVAAVALAPVAVAKIAAREDRYSGMMLGLYVAALGMLPGAIGRCDPIHIFFNGFGVIVLALVVLDGLPGRWKQLPVLAVLLIFAGTQIKNISLYRERLRMALGGTHAEDMGLVDEAALLRVIGSARIAAPRLAPEQLTEDLIARGQYVPGYYCGMLGVWDRHAEERKVSDMHLAEYALVNPPPVPPGPVQLARIERIMRLGMANHGPRPPYVESGVIEDDLKQHWDQVGVFGIYRLYRRR